MTTKLSVTGMTCGHCKASVENALQDLAGVDDATVDLETGAVMVRHSDEVTVDQLSAAVVSAGYSVVGTA